MTIEKFEDIIAWQKARELTRAVYAVTRRNPFAKDFGLVDQIRRAAVSIGSNIAEGFDRGNTSNFKLQTTNFKPQTTNYKLQTTNYKQT